MLWKDIMNPNMTDVDASVELTADGDILDLQLLDIPEEDLFVRVVDEKGRCIGSIRRDILEYVRGTGTAELFAAVLDKIGEAVTVIDEEGRIYYINPAYTRFLGVPAGKVLGRYLQRVEPKSALLTVLKPPHVPVVQKKQLVRSINKYVSLHAYPIFLHGEFRGAVSVFTDITRLNELNQEVARISRVAEEYSRQLEAETVLKQNKVIGQSKVYVNSIVKAVTVAKTDVAVLLRGENGTGKEVFAHLLHENSPRKDKPLITVNCSAIPETLIESELFGYEEGSFTGAKQGGSMGKFQLAQGGTLFLDEIGDMPMPMQAKLLRVLQEGEIEKIGRQKNIPVDVRIIAATNQPLEEMIQRGRFRQDLYYRLNVVSVAIPPLRERGNDILLLADHFLAMYNEKYHKKLRFSGEVYQCFLSAPWPGNVRELQNAVESIVVLSRDEVVGMSDLPEHITHTAQAATSETASRPPRPGDVPPGTLAENMAAYERELLVDALDRCGGDRNKAMERLGLSRRTFYRKLHQHQVK